MTYCNLNTRKREFIEKGERKMKKAQLFLVIAVLVMVVAAVAVFAMMSMQGTGFAMDFIRPVNQMAGHLVCSSTSCIG